MAENEKKHLFVKTKNHGLHGALSKITNFQKSTYKKNNKLGILLVVVGMVSVGCLLL